MPKPIGLNGTAQENCPGAQTTVYDWFWEWTQAGIFERMIAAGLLTEKQQAWLKGHEPKGKKGKI